VVVRSLVIDGLLAVVVAASWLGVCGFARLKSALDRLHCVAFVNVVTGFGLIGAAFVGDGMSDRALKIVLIVAVNLLSGAAVSHATARALSQRGEI
jgi:multisubunit Na+/H+ antiporter MnhG subunit